MIIIIKYKFWENAIYLVTPVEYRYARYIT